MSLTEEEAATYDRQIRLWGLDAQKRLRASRICVLGIFGLGSEVCKNLVLAGIKSLCVVDHRIVDANSVGAQFLVRGEDAGKNIAEAAAAKLQILNPNVQIETETSDPEQLCDDFFRKFDVVAVLGLAAKSSFLRRVNEICRAADVKFCCGEVFGFHGYFFTDLGNCYTFVREESKGKANVSIDVASENTAPENAAAEPSAKRSKGTEDGDESSVDDSVKMVKEEMSFVPWEEAVNSDWSRGASARTLRRSSPIYFVTLIVQAFIDNHGRAPSSFSRKSDFEELCSLRDSILKKLSVEEKIVPSDTLRQCIGELSPVCAITGGVLGQEVIKAVSGRDAPLNNFFFFHGVQGCGMVEKLGYSRDALQTHA